MKLELDERLKHRLIGVAVIISLGAIFAPALMKKSSQRLENNFSVNVNLPPKPIAPNVVMSDEKELFKTIKVAKVTLPDPASEKVQEAAVAKAEEINDSELASALVSPPPVKLAIDNAAQKSAKSMLQVARYPIKKAATVMARNNKAAASKTLAKKVSQQPARIARTATRVTANRREVYAVQLASFSQLSNAQSLVNKLRAKGFKASFMTVPGNHGYVYKVYAGNSPRRLDAVKLKAQLASSMQLNGFVVNTGVS